MANPFDFNQQGHTTLRLTGTSGIIENRYVRVTFSNTHETESCQVDGIELKPCETITYIATEPFTLAPFNYDTLLGELVIVLIHQ